MSQNWRKMAKTMHSAAKKFDWVQTSCRDKLKTRLELHNITGMAI